MEGLRRRAQHGKSRVFSGKERQQTGAKDIRFTRNKANNVVYALVLGWPTEPILVQSLGLRLRPSLAR